MSLACMRVHESNMNEDDINPCLVMTTYNVFVCMYVNLFCRKSNTYDETGLVPKNDISFGDE